MTIDKQPEWHKQAIWLRNIITAIIAFETAIIAFVVALKENPIAVTVVVSTSLIGGILFCLYVVLAKKDSPVLPGEKRVPVFEFRYRIIAFAEAVIIVVVFLALIAFEPSREYVRIAFAGTPTSTLIRASTLGTSTPGTTPAWTSCQIRHTVARGENLNIIARKYGVTVLQIQSENRQKIPHPDVVSEGLELTITVQCPSAPQKETSSSIILASPAPTSTSTSLPTPTPTRTSIPTSTPTFTSTPTRTPTYTSTPTSTPTHTFTPTSSPTYTSTPTSTPTPEMGMNCSIPAQMIISPRMDNVFTRGTIVSIIGMTADSRFVHYVIDLRREDDAYWRTLIDRKVSPSTELMQLAIWDTNIYDVNSGALTRSGRYWIRLRVFYLTENYYDPPCQVRVVLQ